ncbi:MAG: hypothetical protein RM022_022770 [Nostoc sp. EfeVER01]|uniref:hypothetical protein n=1 Tax=unclassified Nostoc TaxID=2593658 RepID=UPI002AD40EF6|nr:MULTISPECIES: hypothetical protein [unclassified Nostoc]MDZ7943819.1 hypothetical protein [Nostoc sp. EfeVER01]MDZ7990749.1 hypothetical protein [Nostoc sp. EspVER01]
MTIPRSKVLAIWHNLSLNCRLNEISTEQTNRQLLTQRCRRTQQPPQRSVIASLQLASSSPSELGGVKGKGEGGKGLNPLTFPLFPLPSPHKRIFGLADY